MGKTGNHGTQDAVIVDGDVYMDSRVIAWELHRIVTGKQIGRAHV